MRGMKSTAWARDHFNGGADSFQAWSRSFSALGGVDGPSAWLDANVGAGASYQPAPGGTMNPIPTLARQCGVGTRKRRSLCLRGHVPVHDQRQRRFDDLRLGRSEFVQRRAERYAAQRLPGRRRSRAGERSDRRRLGRSRWPTSSERLASDAVAAMADFPAVLCRAVELSARCRGVASVSAPAHAGDWTRPRPIAEMRHAPRRADATHGITCSFYIDPALLPDEPGDKSAPRRARIATDVSAGPLARRISVRCWQLANTSGAVEKLAPSGNFLVT